MLMQCSQLSKLGPFAHAVTIQINEVSHFSLHATSGLGALNLELVTVA